MFQKITLFLLRLSLGWYFLYAGYAHLTDPKFSAAGYLQGAKTFTGFYHWLAQPGMLPVTNFLAAWGLTLIGIALILGLFVRLSSILGAVMMVLFYLPVLQWPHIPPHAYLVDEHIIYAAGLLVLAAFRAGRVWGLSAWFARRFPKLAPYVG